MGGWVGDGLARVSEFTKTSNLKGRGEGARVVSDFFS